MKDKKQDEVLRDKGLKKQAKKKFFGKGEDDQLNDDEIAR